MFANKETIVCCSCLQGAWTVGRMMSIARSAIANQAIIHATRNSVREAICAAAGRNGMDS